MQFKHPELLYALFLLVIPIIVHLFQLRKFKKIPFTNVAFLKKVKIQTRKSSQLKKWLTLLTRLLLLAAIIFAFAQPYFSKNKTLNRNTETVIYLDNSFSMEAKGADGKLLKRAIQDIISNVPENEDISILTNTKVYKNTTISAVKNSLLQLDFSSKQLPYNAAILKGKTFFSKDNNTLKNFVFISDFQNADDNFKPQKDSLVNIHAVKLQPINTQNIAIDSAYISNTSPTKLELSVILKNSGNPIDNVPVSLFNNDNLIAKTSTAITDNAKVTFDLPTNEIINGALKINDTHLQFDNTLYFNVNTPEKINVLAISDTETNFLNRIYTKDEFEFTASKVNSLNYSNISTQNLIILYDLKNIPSALNSALSAYSNKGGSLLIIPSEDSNISSYNSLLQNYRLGFKDKIASGKRITTINYSHPLYNNGVFEKRVTNFQYPKVNSFYNLNVNGNSILSFEDGKPFLTGNSKTYLVTAALNTKNSNFKNSPLIVPTFYNIAKSSFKIPQLYYNIGVQNDFEVKVNLQQDGVLSLEKGDNKFIPRQQSFGNKVNITTIETPYNSGIYAIKNKVVSLKNVSYNYSRNESDLSYQDISNLEHITVSDSIPALFETLKSDTKVNALWKWFVIFALILLLIEMLILKYFK